MDPQVLALYEVLERVAPDPMLTLNRAVEVSMVHGRRAELVVLGTLDFDQRVAQTHRRWAVRAHLLELAGTWWQRAMRYQRAARMTASTPEQHYLASRAGRLS